MPPSGKFFHKMSDPIHPIVDSIKPTMATVAGLIAGGGNAAVWLDAIKGWAAVLTVILGAPTAFLILIYWILKVRSEWKNRNNNSSVNELR